MSDVTQILSQIEAGDPSAAEQLLPLIYDELRKLAAARMAQEKPGQTLQATALVHDAYIRLVDVERAQHWNSRNHFFGAAAEAMRRILVENARHKCSIKAGQGHLRCELQDMPMTLDVSPEDILSLDEALTKLGKANDVASELAKLRLFAGLTVDEAADRLDISRRTGFRLWTYARAFMQAELSVDGSAAADQTN